jgi:hypothetical protein
MQAALVLAETHVHRHQHPAGHAALNAGIASLACRALTRHPGCDPAIPDDDRDCPLCWSLAAANGVLPTLPAAELPQPRFDLPRPLPAARGVASVGSVQFQARAPPSA